MIIYKGGCPNPMGLWPKLVPRQTIYFWKGLDKAEKIANGHNLKKLGVTEIGGENGEKMPMIYVKLPNALQVKTGVNRQISMSKSKLSMGTRLSGASIKSYGSQ